MAADASGDSLAAEQAGRDEDPRVGLVQVGAGGTNKCPAVFAGDEQGTLVDLASSGVEKLAPQADRVRAATGLLDRADEF